LIINNKTFDTINIKNIKNISDWGRFKINLTIIK
jgi:hypothetical protein